MKFNKSGFTLIELLVVITIIGILGTGATVSFTSYIQKARDANRITDINALKGAIVNAYQDDFTFMSDASWSTWVDNIDDTLLKYMEAIPLDPKHGQACNNGAVVGESWTSICAYTYASSDDDAWMTDQEYEVSTAFESDGNIENKADTDGGNDNVRYEVGKKIGDTEHSTNLTAITWTPSNITWCTGGWVILMWDWASKNPVKCS